MAFSSEVLTLDIKEHVAWLWLDRPERKNALGDAFWRDFPDAMRVCESAPDVRAVVLLARGPVFSAGIDLQEMRPLLLGDDGSMKSSAADRRALHRQIERMQDAMSSAADCQVPVIAAIQGPCIGAGVDLVTACDIRLCSSDAVFSVRETRMAMVPDLGTLQRLRGIVPEGHLAELVYTGRDIGADRAESIGLVNDVYEDAEALRSGAGKLAGQIAANSPQAVQGSKRLLRLERRQREEEGLAHGALWNTSFLQSADLVEAITAFFEKRPPDFSR